MRWVKLMCDIFEDEKVRMIDGESGGAAAQNLYFRLLCLAGKQGNGGRFAMDGRPYTDAMFAAVLGQKGAQVRKGMALLRLYGLIVDEADCVRLARWDAEQVRYEDGLTSLENRRERQREYSRRYRVKKSGEDEFGEAHGEMTREAHGEMTREHYIDIDTEPEPEADTEPEAELQPQQGSTITTTVADGSDSVGEDGGEAVPFAGAIAYARRHLDSVTDGNCVELAKYGSKLPEDVLCYAVDEAVAHGSPNWAYVRGVLVRWLLGNVRSVADAVAYGERNRTSVKASVTEEKPRFNYQQHAYGGMTAEEYNNSIYYDPSEKFG